MNDTDLLTLVQGAIKSVSDNDMWATVGLLDAIRNELLERTRKENK